MWLHRRESRLCHGEPIITVGGDATYAVCPYGPLAVGRRRHASFPSVAAVPPPPEERHRVQWLEREAARASAAGTAPAVVAAAPRARRPSGRVHQEGHEVERDGKKADADDAAAPPEGEEDHVDRHPLRRPRAVWTHAASQEQIELTDGLDCHGEVWLAYIYPITPVSRGTNLLTRPKIARIWQSRCTCSRVSRPKPRACTIAVTALA